MRIPIYLVICSLEGAFSLLRKSKLLVTGDTSIKHLAAGTHTRIVELSMGSSHLHFTGVYKKNSYILQAKEECSPCGHSTNCVHGDHRCHSRMDPQYVARVVSCIYARDSISLNHLARKFSNSVDVYKTFIDYKFGWFAVPLTVTVNSVFDILTTFYRSAMLQEKNTRDYMTGFLSNLEHVISDKQEWVSRIVQLKIQLDQIRLPENAFQMLNDRVFDNEIAKSLLEFQVRKHGANKLSDITNATILNNVYNALKNDFEKLNDLIQIIFEIERIDQWTNKITSNLEVL